MRYLVLNLILFGSLGVFWCGCASEPSKDVLNPVQEQSEGTAAPKETGSPPGYEKLRSQLDKLGYEGIGLNLENESTLNFLVDVFSDPRVAKRQIKYVYTGLNLEYDPKHDSLTIGGTKDVKAVVDFIVKKIPAK